MAFKDLREFISFLEKRGELKRIGRPVSPILEITEIADRMVKAGGPALLFENVEGSKVPLLINTFASYKRMSWALGGEELDEIPKRIETFIPGDFPSTLRQKIGALLKLKELTGFFPREVEKAPCQEVVLTDNFSLEDLPVMKCWPGDAGRFITLPLVVTKDPIGGRQNLGMYRLQVFDGRTTGMHWHLHHDGALNYRESVKLGKQLEVAVALGGDPATVYAATAPLPRNFDELIFAGMLRGEPVEVVSCKTVNLRVPAHAEIVLEGYVGAHELRREGPFGDHTGYYSVAADYPVFHVTCMTSRRHPIYPSTIVGRPPMEDCYMAKATERIFLPLIKAQLPEIVDINLPLEGAFHNCALISIRKSYPLHASKVMNAVWGMGQMMFTKIIVIVDENVDVQNVSEVAWRVFNNVDPERDIVFMRGPLDVLDHASNTPNYGSKMGIDATRKWPEEGYSREWPQDIVMDEEVKKKVDEKWRELGL